MLSKHTPSSNLIAAFVAAALSLPAGAALAHSSQGSTAHESAAKHPQALIESTQNPMAQHVRLTNQTDMESLNYDQPRRLRICNLTGRMAPTSAAAAGNATQLPLADRPVPLHGPNPVDLKVTYNGKSDQVQPGECYRFRAQDVQLTPSQPLAPGGALDLTVENLSPKGQERTQTAANDQGSNTAANAGSVKDLSAQLKRDDKSMQQATMELNQARAQLAKTTRDLEHTQSREEHVASLEHRTTQAEKERARKAEQQSNAQQNNGRQRNNAQPENNAQPGANGQSNGGQTGTPE